jgi:hypothetical protein
VTTGVDAIGIDTERSKVTIVQAKWFADGRGAPSTAEARAFVQGFRDLIDARFDRFNAKIQAKAADLTSALDDTDIQFQLVLAYTGTDPLPDRVRQVFDDVFAQINDVSQIASLEILDQARLHQVVRRGAAGRPPDLEVTLDQWGRTGEPYDAVYGQVSVDQIATWWREHSGVLFGDNLRMFMPDSSVNDAIIQTLMTHPQRFWYFNNGITVLCERIAQAPRGSANRRTGRFTFERARVVNGAQTVGSIGTAHARAENGLGDAYVHARFISLDGVPDDFASEVTKATNTQNRILPRDFVSLDEQQERLRTELRLDRKTYAIKSGEPDPPPDEGCTVLDATVALACAHSVELSVLAKREVGRLWDDVTKPPYTDLFSRATTGTRLWRAVQVLRAVEEELARQRAGLDGRDRLVAVHGNRFIAALVMSRLPAGSLDDQAAPFEAALSRVAGMTAAMLTAVRQVVALLYPANYPASIFKNAAKCADIAARVP